MALYTQFLLVIVYNLSSKSRQEPSLTKALKVILKGLNQAKGYKELYSKDTRITLQCFTNKI